MVPASEGDMAQEQRMRHYSGSEGNLGHNKAA
jgi:hypothetical protein